ncbi:hypothetical protein [Dolichospermum phage Dfl-JY45]
MQADVTLLTNERGEWLDEAGALMDAVTEQEMASVPFGCGPGFVQWRLVCVEDAIAVLVTLDVPFDHPHWGDGAEPLPPFTDSQTYAAGVASYAACAVEVWAEAHGVPWWRAVEPSEDVMEGPLGALRVGVMVPIASIEDQAQALSFARRVFGGAVGLNGLPAAG